MKCSLSVIQTLIFLFSLLLTACGGSIEQQTVEAPEEPAESVVEVEDEDVAPEDIGNDPDLQTSLEETFIEEQTLRDSDRVKLTKAEKIKQKKCKKAYSEAKTYLGTPDEELKLWEKFIKDYPGRYNPYLDEAKRKIETHDLSKQNVNLPTRTKKTVVKKGTLSEEEITDTVHSHIAEVQFCYQKNLEDDPDLRGKVWVEFSVSETGDVVSPEVVNSAFANANLESCILACMRRWEFPKPIGGETAVITYPFHFEAHEN